MKTLTEQLQQKATWAQKIRAIEKAARSVGEQAAHRVKRKLERGAEHMQYKDYRDFKYDCEEQYIFGEAAHLIQQLELPFDAALEVVMVDDILAANGWTGSGNGLICNPDPILGGIIDKAFVTGAWFVVFHDAALDVAEDYKTREEAFSAFVKTIDSKYVTA
jgi:hypothetical protein